MLISDDVAESPLRHRISTGKAIYSTRAIEKMGYRVVSTTVRAGEGVWIPSGMPYLVSSEERLSIGVAWSVLLPRQITAAYSTMEANRILRVDSAIPVKELIVQAAIQGDFLNTTLLADIISKEHFNWPSERHLEASEECDTSSNNFFRCEVCQATIFNRVYRLKQQSYCPECVVEMDIGIEWIESIQQKFDKEFLEGLIQNSTRMPLPPLKPQVHIQKDCDAKPIIVSPSSTSFVEIHHVQTLLNASQAIVVRYFGGVSQSEVDKHI